MIKTKRPSSILFYYAVLTVSLFLFGCDKKEVEPAKELVRPAKFITVGDQFSKTIREFPGEVEASNKAEQAFRVSGEIIKLQAKAGMKIKKGQVLAQLDPKDFKLKLDDRKAKYDLAKIQFDRTTDLLEKKLIPIADFDKAKSNMLASKSDLALAQANYNYTFLRAPFDGIVSKVLIDNHKNVQAQQTILHVQTINNIDIVFQVPASVFAMIKIPQNKQQLAKNQQLIKTVITFDDHPEFHYSDAKIKERDTVADSKTNTYRIKMTMKTPKDFNVLSGMIVTINVDFSKIMVNSSNTIIVPAAAVFLLKTNRLITKNVLFGCSIKHQCA